MKIRLILSSLAILAIAAMSSPVFAQTDETGGHGYGVGGFLDENGDGFNDLAPDADGDGIPNGLDPDYVPAADGSGMSWGPGDGTGCEDGETMKMHQYGEGEGAGAGTGGGFGPGDGTGLDGTGPADGTGFGPGTGTGTTEPGTTGGRSRR